MNKLFKYSAFFVSYTPLWTSILYVDFMSLFYHKTPSKWAERIGITLIVLGYIMSIVIMMRTFKSLSKENSEKFRITDVQEQRTAALLYLAKSVR